MNEVEKNIDILCVGEVLVDFIGHQSGVKIRDTSDYHRYLGGSPTNVALNSARLGLRSAIVSTIGGDSFGEYIVKKLDKENVDTKHVKKVKGRQTSVIFVSRTEGTPDFIPFRKADYFITEDQIPKETLFKTTIFHTTCFALSKNPAQSTILKKAEEAHNLGCKLSIDVNYAKQLWESREIAFEVIKSYCSLNPLVKISEDDMFRLFEEHLPHAEIFDFFHSCGAELVCLTLGSEGVKLSQKGEDIIELPAVKIDKILDATGAGDAFWSGFLYSYIKGNSTMKSLDVALKLAALKLQNIGRLPDHINILSKLL